MTANDAADNRAKILDYILDQYPGLRSRNLAYGDSLVGVLDSLAVLGVIGYMEPEFGVELSPSDVTDENFESIEAMAALVSRLQRAAA